MKRGELDAFDFKILELLQRNGAAELQEVAAHACLSITASSRRIKALREAGVIQGWTTRLSCKALGLTLTGFVRVRTSDHSEAWTEAFERKVSAMDEVLELHRMAGDVDYMLKVVTRDLDSYDRLYRRLIRIPGLTDVTASFSMDAIKVTTALPLAA